MKSLSELLEERCLEQKMTLAGIVYLLTPKSGELTEKSVFSDDEMKKFKIKIAEYKKILVQFDGCGNLRYLANPRQGISGLGKELAGTVFDRGQCREYKPPLRSFELL